MAALQLRGEVRLRLSPGTGCAVDAGKHSAGLLEISLENALRQGGDADDDAGETVERGGNCADQTGLMHSDKIGCKLFGSGARTRRIDDRPAGKHLNGTGETGAVAVRRVQIFEPMQRRLSHVARDARQAARELVRDQDSAAGAGVRRPPADPVGLLFDEVGEYLTFEGSPVRQLDADGGSCIRLRRLQGFRIGFIQAGEIGGSHEPSVASGTGGRATSLGAHGGERALGHRGLHHPRAGLPRFVACVVEKDQARSRADAGDRTHRRRMILAEHETEIQPLREQAVDNARIVRDPVWNEAGILRQEVGRHRRGHGDGFVREGRLAGEIAPQQLQVRRIQGDGSRVAVEHPPRPHRRAPQNAQPEIADLLARQTDRRAHECRVGAGSVKRQRQLEAVEEREAAAVVQERDDVVLAVLAEAALAGAAQKRLLHLVVALDGDPARHQDRTEVSVVRATQEAIDTPGQEMAVVQFSNGSAKRASSGLHGRRVLKGHGRTLAR